MSTPSRKDLSPSITLKGMMPISFSRICCTLKSHVLSEVIAIPFIALPPYYFRSILKQTEQTGQEPFAGERPAGYHAHHIGKLERPERTAV